MNVNAKINEASVWRMSNLRNVFELVVNRLNNWGFTGQKQVKKTHQPILHIATGFSEKLDSELFQKMKNKFFRNIAAIPSASLTSNILPKSSCRKSGISLGSSMLLGVRVTFKSWPNSFTTTKWQQTPQINTVLTYIKAKWERYLGEKQRWIWQLGSCYGRKDSL